MITESPVSYQKLRSIELPSESLIKRNFKYTQGILTLLDGSKGLRKAADESFGNYALVQRCQWHKRENVLSYLSQEHQDQYRGRL